MSCDDASLEEEEDDDDDEEDDEEDEEEVEEREEEEEEEAREAIKSSAALRGDELSFPTTLAAAVCEFPPTMSSLYTLTRTCMRQLSFSSPVTTDTCSGMAYIFAKTVLSGS